MKTRLISVFAVTVSVAVLIFACAVSADDSEIDRGPLGGAFPVGLYSVGADHLERVSQDGFNMVLPYGFGTGNDSQRPGAEQYLQIAQDLGMAVIFPLGTLDAARPGLPIANAETVERYAVHENIIWWYLLPEERRFWYTDDEMPSLVEQAAVVAAHDPLNRPRFMYNGTSYGATDLAPYVPHIDVIGAGGYTNYALKPRPWVRWRIEQEIEAIELAGAPARVFPIAVLQMFPTESPEEVPMTESDAYHDAYLSVACGAKAILIHTYNRVYKDKVDPGVYEGYARAAREINGPERLGEAVLAGTAIHGVECSVESGPKHSESFDESFTDTPGRTFEYPSITFLAVEYEGVGYLIAVNSASQAVGASFEIPIADENNSVEVLFESRQIEMDQGALVDRFEPESSHVYRFTVGGTTSSEEVTR